MRHPLFAVAVLSSPLFFLSACSATPGDAAYRSSHFPQAAALYEKEANRGDALAATKLGNLYYYRPGLPEDHQKAISWYEKAVSLGDLAPMWSIGTIYRDGTNNVPRDVTKAQQWFERGAEKGQHYSMYALADLYASGAIGRDDVRGLMWFEAVTEFAHKSPDQNEGVQFVLRDPKKIKTLLEARMSRLDIEKAQLMAREWVAAFVAKGHLK